MLDPKKSLRAGTSWTVENAQTVSLRGVLGADAGWGARGSNLDLRSRDVGAQIASSSSPAPSPSRPDSSQ
jgi:hypothetical protein